MAPMKRVNTQEKDSNMDDEMKCPLCNGELKPGAEVPGYAICAECKTWWQESALITLRVRKEREKSA